MGVPSNKSAPETTNTNPFSFVSSTRSNRTLVNPIGLGRKGERVANTPIRLLPPKRGGRTVGDQDNVLEVSDILEVSRVVATLMVLEFPTSENPHNNHKWEYSSTPRNASRTRYAGANIIRVSIHESSRLWRGIPNFCEKPLCAYAMTCN